MTDHAKMPNMNTAYPHWQQPGSPQDVRDRQIINSDSEDGEDFLATEGEEAEDNASIVGISISKTQSRLKSPTTPRAEKVAAMDGQPDFFHRGFDAMEPLEELPARDISPPERQAPSTTQSRKQSPPFGDPRKSSNHPSPPAGLSLPSPWRAGPKTFERQSETSNILGSVFRKRSSSGPEKRAKLPLPLPNFRIFGTSGEKGESRKARGHDQPQAAGSRPRLDGAVSSRDTSDGLGPKPRVQFDSSKQSSQLELPTTPRVDPSSELSFFRAAGKSHSRPPMGLRRATSDQSLYLARTLSKASSLGDDSRFENVNEQINVRLKAIRDSWQDSNLRRTLPSLPKPPSIFSASRTDLTTQGETPRNSQPVLLPNGLESWASNSRSPDPTIYSKKMASKSVPSSADHPIFTEALDDLVGDIVVLGGYRGSILREAQPPHRRVWLPLFKAGLNIRKVDLEVDFDDETRAMEKVQPDGMLTHIGPVDISRRLLKRLRNSENARQGRLRVHEYGYDWRLSPHRLSQQLLSFLAQLPSNSSDTPSVGRGAVVIAHSLGGLITRWAVNARPDLFAGVVYAGVPDTCVNILGPLRNGDPVLMSSRVLTAQVNLSIRTSILLLPLDGKCFIDKDTNEEYPVDFYDVNDWLMKYRFSPCTDPPLPSLPVTGKPNGLLNTVANIMPDVLVNSLLSRRDSSITRSNDAIINDKAEAAASEAQTTRANAHAESMPNSGMAPQMGPSSADERSSEPPLGITISREAAVAYLARTLPEIKRFRLELAHDASIQAQNAYPPLAVIYGKTEPTVYGARVHGRDGIARSDAYSSLSFRSGDGVVLSKSAQLPQGYRAARGGVIASERGHVTLLSDLEAVGRSLLALSKARKAGVGLGTDSAL